MTDLNDNNTAGRPSLGRVFLSRIKRIQKPPLELQLNFWIVFATGLFLDLWSKRAVFDWLKQQPSGYISVINGFFRLVAVENAGAAFGIAAGQRVLLTVISIIALAVLFFIIFFGNAKRRVVFIALGLFTAGVCGNLYDRVFNDGMVRDFIDIYYGKYHWPTFNVADSMLCIAVGLLLITGVFIEKSSQEHAQRHK